jgi:ABC transporter substrate binding protein
MRRRQFIALLGAAAAAGRMARAQQSVRRIAVPVPGVDDPALDLAFEQGLAQRGWMVGRNVQIDRRFAIDSTDKTNVAIAELLRRPPDVIVAFTSRTVAALQKAMSTVPLVFATIYEPVAQGFVQSLAHPGGNATGFTNIPATIGGSGWSCSRRWRQRSPASPTSATRAIPFRYSPILPWRRPRTTMPLRSHWQRFTGRRTDRTAGRLPVESEQADCRTRCARKAACDLWICVFRCARRLDFIWRLAVEATPPGWRLRRSHLAWRETRGPAGAAAVAIRIGHQPQSRQGARPPHSAHRARQRR